MHVESRIVRALIALTLIAIAASSDAAGPGDRLDSPAPRSPKDELATFHVSKGFRIELVAAEPNVVDPVALAFDEDGRLFVAEMRGYPNDGVGYGSISTGKVKLLEDRDGDGFYETSTIFADRLRFPTSVMPWRGGLIVAVAPDLIFFEDTDGDGRADRHRRLYEGFDIANIQSMVNHLQWGMDNWVYACAGARGGTVRSAEKSDAPAVTLRGRGVRFHPEQPGSLEPMSGGGQFGLAADDWQNWFTTTNSQHLRQIILPDHYLRRNPYLPVSAVTLDIPDHGAACQVHRLSTFEAWRVERTRRRKGGPDARRFASTELVPGGFITSACSPVVYNADAFPAEYRGNTFVCDPANNLIHRDVLVPDGPIFRARRGDANHEFLASTDNWFRPVNLAVGPDGALYIADFYRPVIETPLSLPDDIKKRLNLETQGRGRIWRVVAEGAPARKKPALRKAPTAELVANLDNLNSWWRLTAQRLLMERQDRSAAKPLAALAGQAKTAPGRAHALWTLHGLRLLDDALIEHALSDASPGVRQQALRLAEEHLAASPRLRAAALRLVNDPEVSVRFQLAFSLGAFDGPETTAALTRLLRADGDNPWMQMAILSSASRSAAALLTALIHDPGFLRDATTSRLQLLTRLAALTGARAEPADLQSVLQLISASGPGANWQRAILDGLGQGLQNSRRSLGRMLEQPTPEWRQAADRVRPFFERAAQVARDGKRSAAERGAAVRLLGYGPFATVAPALQDVLQPQNPTALQLAAVRSLSLQDNPKVPEVLLAQWTGYSPAVRREATEALFARTDRLKALFDAVERKQLAGLQLEPARREQLRKHPDAELRRRAIAFLGNQASPDRKKVIEEYGPALAAKGDAARGKEVFKKTCSTCHRLENVGVEVGPDLLSALRTKTPESLLVDILDPSREVDPRYVNYLVTTSEGRLFSGMIAVEAPSSVTLRRAERAEDVILRSQIAEIQATAKSVMPEELEKQLSRQDLADVIAYLLAVADGGKRGGTAPPFYKDKDNLLAYMDAEGHTHPVQTAADWAKRRAHVLENMQIVMGPLPEESRKVPLDVRVEEEVKTDQFVRRKITFAVEKGDRLWAYLFIPNRRAGRIPAVLCPHPTHRVLGKGVPAGFGPKPDLYYAVHLAERGYVTLAPDYLNSGDYKFDWKQHGYASATMKGIWNHMRCVDLLQSLPEVDAERIGVIGHSLGGHNSMFVAVFDPRIKCVVSNCGFCSFPRYYKGNLAGWSHDGYMPRIRSVYQLDPKKMPFDFTEVVAALAPRPFLASAPINDSNFDVQGVKECIAAAKPVYELLGAGDRLAANYPDCQHDFPADARQVAYAWLDRWLKMK